MKLIKCGSFGDPMIGDTVLEMEVLNSDLLYIDTNLDSYFFDGVKFEGIDDTIVGANVREWEIFKNSLYLDTDKGIFEILSDSNIKEVK